MSLIQSAWASGRPVVTTNYVLAELSALLIVHIDRDLDKRSWGFMAKHRDKDFSLVDCSSFLVMKDRGVSNAITTDQHFEQAGFRCLLR